MALKILYQRVQGSLRTDISAATTIIPIDSSTLATLQAQVNFAGGDWTYLTLINEIYSEEVKVTSIDGLNLVVQRARSGSTAQVFHVSDTDIVDHVGKDAIVDIITANPIPSELIFTGGGIASAVQTGDIVAVNVDAPVFTGTDGIAIVGNWPNLTFANEGGGEGCGCSGGGGEGGDGVNQVIVTSAILQANVDGSILNLILPSPSFQGNGGVTISGSWATGYTISGGGGGGTGTVVQVNNGTGLTLTGSPNTNPTLSITNTGVAPGTYGGFTINAQGQITSAAGGYNPISTITLANGGTATGSGTGYTITLHSADVGVLGIVALADSSAPLNASDDSTAVTPKILAAAIATVGGTFTSGGSSLGEADGDYTNVISSSAITLTLAAGEKAIVIGEVVVVGTAPLTPAQYGVAVFNSGNVKQYGSKKISQSKQMAIYSVNGPVNFNISLVTTALATGESVTSSFLAAIIF
jgi:hypothetical protein